MPQSVTARAATAADYEHFVRLFPELATGDPIPDRARWERLQAPDTLFFEVDGAVVGYSFAQALRGVGYVRHVVVDPAWRGRGVGRAILDELAARLQAAGCARWCLNVKPDNEPALRLYRSVGLEREYTLRSFRLGWDVVDRLPRGDRRVVARPVDPAEDAAIEAAFGLPEGQLAGARAAQAYVLLRLVDPAAPEDARVGVASFDPGFPGAFPFRVAHPTLAVPLLEAIRPHARPEPAYIQIVVEDDEELSRVLLDAGATLRLEALHLGGPLRGAP